MRIWTELAVCLECCIETTRFEARQGRPSGGRDMAFWWNYSRGLFIKTIELTKLTLAKCLLRRRCKKTPLELAAVTRRLGPTGTKTNAAVAPQAEPGSSPADTAIRTGDPRKDAPIPDLLQKAPKLAGRGCEEQDVLSTATVSSLAGVEDREHPPPSGLSAHMRRVDMFKRPVPPQEYRWRPSGLWAILNTGPLWATAKKSRNHNTEIRLWKQIRVHNRQTHPVSARKRKHK